MKIWIDFINTPQVTFFIPFIADLRKDGHDILLTCRDSGNTVDLLKQRNLKFFIIGSKVGNGIFQKFLFSPQRLFKLYHFVRRQKPDIAASQSSFYQPIVARISGIPCLYTNDNEHAKGNLFGFLFATKVVLPRALQNLKFTKRWPLRSKLSFYPGVKEAIYLSQFPDLLNISSGTKNKIYFRPEPWTAQYYKGQLNFFDDLLLKLIKEFKVIVLPRDIKQAKHYMQWKFRGLSIAQKPLSLYEIVSDCLLFIGAGGSMTREMAVIEIPVLSIYQSKLLCVDKYLIDKGLMIAKPDITYEEIKAALVTFTKSKKNGSVLQKGRESYSLIKSLINNLDNE